MHSPRVEYEAARRSGYRAVHQIVEEWTPRIPSVHELPSWAYPKSVLLLAEERLEKGDAVPLSFTAGAALPTAFMCALVLWVFYPCFMLLIMHVSPCQESTRFRWTKYPWWAWSAVVPVLATCLFAQWNCIRFMLFPKMQILVKGYKLMGCLTRRGAFNLFLAQTLCFSTFYIADMASDSAFLGCVMRTLQCGEAAELELVWDKVMRASILSFIHINCLKVDLSRLCITAWGLAFLQILYALADTVPIPSQFAQVDYDVMVCAGKSKKYNFHYTTILRYLTKDDVKQNHGSALMMMAEASGMHGVVAGDEEFALAKAEHELQTKKQDFEIRALDHVESQTRRSTLRVLLSACLVNGFQVNIQVSVLGMVWSISRDSIANHFQMGLSITIGLTMLLTRIIEAISTVKQLWGWHSRILNARDPSRDEQHQDRVYIKAQRLRAWTILLLVGTCACVVVWLYAVLKFGNLFRCKDALWNINGCVDLDSVIQKINNSSDTSFP